jgi:hypothetical protein
VSVLATARSLPATTARSGAAAGLERWRRIACDDGVDVHRAVPAARAGVLQQRKARRTCSSRHRRIPSGKLGTVCRSVDVPGPHRTPWNRAIGMFVLPGRPRRRLDHRTSEGKARDRRSLPRRSADWQEGVTARPFRDRSPSVMSTGSYCFHTLRRRNATLGPPTVGSWPTSHSSIPKTTSSS